jgi:hypothetical protein
VDLEAISPEILQRLSQVQIPLWSILTFSVLIFKLSVCPVQIPLWSILTGTPSMGTWPDLCSDSSMVDINKYFSASFLVLK